MSHSKINLVWWQLLSWSTGVWSSCHGETLQSFLWGVCDSENQTRRSSDATHIWKDWSGWLVEISDLIYLSDLMNWSLFWGRWCNVLTYQCLSPVWGSLWGRRASIESLSDPTTALGSPSDTHDTHDGRHNLFSINDVAVLVLMYCTNGFLFVCIFWFFVANMLNVTP